MNPDPLPFQRVYETLDVQLGRVRVIWSSATLYRSNDLALHPVMTQCDRAECI